MKFQISVIVLSAVLLCQINAQCSDDSVCTDLCGYAGKGKCVNGTHCVCETCPQRSTAELSLAYTLKTCLPEPICHLKCPSKLLAGKLYSGHICSPLNNLINITCICFCMPTTLKSLGTVLRCPALPNLGKAQSPNNSSTIKKSSHQGSLFS